MDQSKDKYIERYYFNNPPRVPAKILAKAKNEDKSKESLRIEK